MLISDRFPTPPANRLLLIQLGDIGDVVWSLPALQAVRETYPAAELAVLLRAGCGSLLAAHRNPPVVFEVRKGRGGWIGGLLESLRLVRDLRRRRFDMVFDLRGDERGAYMARATGAPLRAAQHYANLSWLRNRLFTHLAASLPRGPASDAAEQSLHILRAFGIEAASAAPSLPLSQEVQLRATRLLAAAGIVPDGGDAGGIKTAGGSVAERPFVTINPFSRWSYKEWGPEKWRQLIDWLVREVGVAVVVVGSADEEKRADSLIGACPARVYHLAGRTTLAELAGVLGASRLHIGVDSAAPHIAAAVGTPTVTLYGPSNWRYWLPPGGGHRAVVSPMDCIPCGQKGCEGKGKSLCLDNLEVAQVQRVIREVLAG